MWCMCAKPQKLDDSNYSALEARGSIVEQAEKKRLTDESVAKDT